MNILDTKEKIQNTTFHNLDELLEVMYFFSKGHYVSNDFLQEICDTFPQFHMNAKQLDNKLNDYHRMFLDKTEMILQKISNTTFVRKETKNLYKQLHHVSQSRIKKSIVELLSYILIDVSQKMYQLSFTNEDIENLIALLSDENQLQNEFYEFQIRYINNMDNALSKPNIKLKFCIIYLFSDYYCHFYFDNQNGLEDIKKNIHSVMAMSKEELYEYAKKLKASEARDLSTSQQTTHASDLIKEVYPSTEKPKSPFDDENIIQTRKNTMDYIIDYAASPFDKMIVDKTLEYYHDYFHLESESENGHEFLQYYLMNVIQSLKHRRRHLNDGTKELWKCYLVNSCLIYQEHIEHTNHLGKNIYNPMIVNDFFFFLAHSLLHGNQAFKDELMHYCLDLLYTKHQIAQNYTAIMNDIQQNTYQFNYPPHQMYETIVITSVIYELDSDKSIAKDIRHLLMKHYQHIYDHLMEYNQKGVSRCLRSHTIEHDHKTLNEYAVMFLLSYFKEPVYITIIAPLVLQFGYIMLEYISDYLGEEIATSKLKTYEKKVTKLIAQLKKSDIDEQDISSITYSSLFKVATNHSFVYDDFDNSVYML